MPKSDTIVFFLLEAVELVKGIGRPDAGCEFRGLIALGVFSGVQAQWDDVDRSQSLFKTLTAKARRIEMKIRYVISAIAVLPAISSAQLGNLCSELAKIQKSEPQFADLRGTPMSGEKWQSRIPSIGGIGNCVVDAMKDSATWLRCETSQFETEEAARAKASPLLDAIPKCLGQPWTVSKTDLGKVLEGHTFSSVGAPVSFQVSIVRMDFINMKTMWKVWVWALMNDKSAQQAEAEVVPVLRPMDPWPQDTKPFCDDLQKVIGSAKDGFESIKGRSTSDKSWKSQLALDSTSSCRIYSFSNSISYSCDAGRQTDREVIAARRDVVVASVRACVDRSWQASRRISSSGTEIAEFESSLEPISIQVRLRNSSGEYRLSVDVDRQ